MSYFSENCTFSKILQPHLLSRSRTVTSYRRRHHGDASSELQRIHHIYGKAQWITDFTSPTRSMWQDEQTWKHFRTLCYSFTLRSRKLTSLSSVSSCRKIVGKLTFTSGWTWSAGRPDHVTVAAWPRFYSPRVSLSVLAADSGCVKHVGLFLADVCDRGR